MKNISELKYAYTHGSIFHADDIFATAFLLTINPDIQVARTNSMDLVQSVQDNADTIVYDIGEGEYDHHQKDKALRPWEDGYYTDKDSRVSAIPYCSFGLLWRDYGRILCPAEKARKKVDRDLVLPIDKNDNGVSHSTLTNMFMQFNPGWDEPGDDAARYAAFMECVSMAQNILKQYCLRANSEVKAEELVLKSQIVDGKILVMDRYLPWQDTVVNQMPDILFVVYPSNRGGYNVQTVPSEPGSFTGRKLFPEKWLGNPDPELGMTFCHPGNFLLATVTLEQSINCARLAVAG